MQPVRGVQDAAAPAGDLLVAQAVDLIQKLLLAVRMGVAERREEPAAAGIDPFVGRRSLSGAEIGDPTVFDQQPGVLQTGQFLHGGPFAPVDTRLGQSDQRADMFDQQAHNPRTNSTEAAIWGYITSSVSMKGTRSR